MVPGLFSWFSWFQVGFSWFFMVPGWFFSRRCPPELYPGQTIQSRSAARISKFLFLYFLGCVLAWGHPYGGHGIIKQGVFKVYLMSSPQAPFPNSFYFEQYLGLQFTLVIGSVRASQTQVFQINQYIFVKCGLCCCFNCISFKVVEVQNIPRPTPLYIFLQFHCLPSRLKDPALEVFPNQPCEEKKLKMYVNYSIFHIFIYY